METHNSKKILLYGMYGSINLGDELIYHAVANGLKQINEESELWIVTGNAEKSSKFAITKDYNYIENMCFGWKFWFKFPRIIKKISDTDIIIIGGGGLFQDQYSWRLSAGSLLVAALGIFFKRYVFIVGVGIGPLHRKCLQKIMAWIFPCLNHICVRDQFGYETLKEIGISGNNVSITADVVPSLDLRQFQRVDTQRSSCRKISFILRDWPGLDYHSLANLLDILVLEGYKIQLHCYQPDNDARFYRNILANCQTQTKESIKVFVPENLEEAILAINCSSLVISMRLHGCILAMHLKVPLIPVVYEVKVREFIQQLGLIQWLKKVEDLNSGLADQIDSVLNFWQQNHTNILSRYETIRNNSKENFKIIEQNINFQQEMTSSLPHRIIGLKSIMVLLMYGFIFDLAHIIFWPLKKIIEKILSR